MSNTSRGADCASSPKGPKAQTIAERQAECVICFEPLCSAPVAVLRQGRKRICCHFFHKECAVHCPQHYGCPLCRRDFNAVAPVPPLASPMEWFETMDMDESRELDQREVLFAVAATLPVELEVLELVLPQLWTLHGKQPQESLSYFELLGPDGLLWQIPREGDGKAKGSAREQDLKAPSVAYDKQGWFEYWDKDKSATLEREEVVRGLVKGFKSDVPAKMCKKILRMRCIVEEMWPSVDIDGNDRVSMHEFCREGGLADLIMFRLKARGVKSPRRGISPDGTKPLSPRRKERRRSTSPTGKYIPIALRPQSPARPATPNRRGSTGSADSRQSQRAATWNCQIPVTDTDVPDDPTDSPKLVRRPALGFVGELACIRRRRSESWSVAGRQRAATKDNHGGLSPRERIKRADSMPVRRARRRNSGAGIDGSRSPASPRSPPRSPTSSTSPAHRVHKVPTSPRRRKHQALAAAAPPRPPAHPPSPSSATTLRGKKMHLREVWGGGGAINEDGDVWTSDPLPERHGSPRSPRRMYRQRSD